MYRVAVLLALVSLLVASATAAAQVETDAKRDAVQRINQLRLANGAPPIAFSAKLDDAAQRHANDMAARGFVDITGSDGTSTLKRIDAASQPSYDGTRPYAESVYAGQSTFTFEDALKFLSEDGAQRTPLLSDRFREVGIGIATDGVRTYWSIVYGATPNVFPILINGGAASTDDLAVLLQLSQEAFAPEGRATALGRITELRIAEGGDFTKAAWQAWQPRVPFVLARRSAKELRTVFVEFRDATGRSAQSQSSIVVTSKGLAATAVPAPTATQPPLQALATLPPPTPEPTKPGPRPTSTVIEIKPLEFAGSATPPPPPPPTVAPTLAATTQVIASNTDIAQSRVVTDVREQQVQIAQTTSPRSSIFQPRDQTRLPGWVLPVFLALQTGVLIFVALKIFRR